jgi:hypothetical protein
LTQSLTITEPAGQRWAQITRTPFTTWHQVIIDGQKVAQVRHQFLGWNNCTVDSASGRFVARGSFLGWQYTISKEERVVARLSKQGILPASFEVGTADGEDDLFLLCLVLAMFQSSGGSGAFGSECCGDGHATALARRRPHPRCTRLSSIVTFSDRGVDCPSAISA